MEKADLTCNLEERQCKQGKRFLLKKETGLLLNTWQEQSLGISRILPLGFLGGPGLCAIPNYLV